MAARKTPQLVDRTGSRYGRLVVTGRDTSKTGREPYWFCACDCGNALSVMGRSLRNGDTKSCGCLKNKHGHSWVKGHTATYESWIGMRQRCLNPKNARFADYGGRGITICQRWDSFANFLADMGERPEGKSLDRFPNNDGNYEPGNCRWATNTEQANNRRPRRWGKKPAEART